MSLPFGLRAWRVLTGMASPFARLLLRRRATRDKEDWTRLNERLGMAGLARPEGRLVWIHGASVGESLSALPLIAKLLEHTNVLVTSGTVTSAAMMGQRLPPPNGDHVALHQFLPLDMPGAVNRFLDHWKPDAGLFVESDLWPNLILGAASRGVKLALVNARLSPRSARRWARLAPGLARALLVFVIVREEFRLVACQIGMRRAVAAAALAGETQIERLAHRIAFPRVGDDFAAQHFLQEARAAAR
jgi:3-deoxy-D-manno-octulosonic-acid transferase